MTSKEQEEINAARRVADKALARLQGAKAGSADGAENEYARANKKLTELRQAAGETGLMGLRRLRYKSGV